MSSATPVSPAGVPPAQRDPWKYRRRIIFLSLLFCAGVVMYALAGGDATLDAATRQAAITQAFWAGAAIIGSYVFGAAWDDKGKPQ